MQNPEYDLKSVEFQEQDLADVGGRLKSAKTDIKEFEKEASFAGWPPAEISLAKRDLVAKLNALVILHKEKKRAHQQRKALLANTAAAPHTDAAGQTWWGGGVDLRNEESVAKASNQQLINAGRQVYQDDIQRLQGMERLIHDTQQVGATTLVTLQDQTRQMERMVDDLDDIQFSLKRAKLIMRDIWKAAATDKCIMMLFALVILGIIAFIAIKEINK